MSDTIKLCHLGVGCIAYETCRTDDLRSGGHCIVREAIAAEREECAKIADAIAERWYSTDEKNGGPAAEEVAAAIRSRSNPT